MSKSETPDVEPFREVNIDKALTDALDIGRRSLAFERGQFGEFFDVQSQLAQNLLGSLTPFGQIPESLVDVFRQNIMGAQTARGLATSPIGATEEARGLAGLALPIFQATTGAAQNFLGGFKPTTGFTPSASNLFGNIVAQRGEANRSIAEAQTFRNAFKSQQKAQRQAGFGNLAGLALGAFGGPIGALAGSALSTGLGGSPASGFGGSLLAGGGGGPFGQLGALFGGSPMGSVNVDPTTVPIRGVP